MKARVHSMHAGVEVIYTGDDVLVRVTPTLGQAAEVTLHRSEFWRVASNMHNQTYLKEPASTEALRQEAGIDALPAKDLATQYAELVGAVRDAISVLNDHTTPAMQCNRNAVEILEFAVR